MTRVVSFDIAGLAGRKKNVKHQLNDDVNVLWGLNGSGKTSVLKILHSALMNETGLLATVPFEAAEVTFWSHKEECTYTRTIKREDVEKGGLETLSKTGRIRLRDVDNYRLAAAISGEGRRWNTTPDQKRSELPFQHAYLNISRISEGARRGSSTGISAVVDEADFDRLFAEQVQTIWRRYNTESLEKIRSAQEDGIAEVLSAALAGRNLGMAGSKLAQANDFTEEEAYALVSTFFRRGRVNLRLGSFENFVNNYREDPFLQHIVCLIFEVQREIDAVQAPQRKLQELINDLFSVGKELVMDGRELKVRLGKQELALESLSSGEKQMLRLLVETTAAEESSVIVDEPEISLHVDWQHRLVESLRIVNPHAQLILATHSPEVMAELPDSQTFQI